MDFMKIFLRSVSALPAVVQSVEALYGSDTGAQKREAAIALVGAAINIFDATETKTIVDPARFTAALGVIVDGVVDCLNASLWAQPRV
jgi:hypothetical protein